MIFKMVEQSAEKWHFSAWGGRPTPPPAMGLILPWCLVRKD